MDLEKQNAIGTLDKLTTNIALSIIAVVPTFLTCIFMPWRLSTLLYGENPDGRMGMLLSPGAFFPLSLVGSFTAAAIFAIPEIINYNGAYIGPALAVSVQEAISQGNIWKTLATIMPIYGASIFLGVLGALLTPWAHPDWSLRVSLKAAFYVTGTMASWMMLSGTLIDLLRVSTGNSDIGSVIYPILWVFMIGLVVWMYSGFFRNGGALSWGKSIALGVAMFGFIFGILVGISFVMRP